MRRQKATALTLVQETLTKHGASSDTVQSITEALIRAFDDEQAETLREAETMLIGALEDLQ